MVLDNLPKGFTAISLDESFFFFDSLVRKVWIFKNTRPVVRITGSHQQSCLFGAVSLDREDSYSDSIIISTKTHSTNS